MSRPRHQDGWITEKAGNYYGHFNRYIFDPISGEKKRRHEAVVLGAKSQLKKWDAKDKLKQIIADELGSEQSIRPDPAMSFEWFVENRFIPMREGGWRPATKATITHQIRCYLIRPFGKMPLDQIDEFQLQVFLNKLASRFSHSLVQKCHTRLKAIMRMARKQHFIIDDPAEDLRMPVTRSPEKPTITWVQINLLLENIKNARDKCLFAVAVLCALRTSEVFGLRWGSLRGNHFMILDTAWEGELFPNQVKTKASRALVPIPDELQTFISAWRTICPDTSDGALMFPTIGRGDRKGKAVPFRANLFMRHRIYPIAEKLGIPKHLTTFRVLRRTAATDLQNFGTVKDTQTALRHEDPTTTLGEYIQPIPESVRSAVNARATAIRRGASVGDARRKKSAGVLHTSTQPQAQAIQRSHTKTGT